MRQPKLIFIKAFLFIALLFSSSYNLFAQGDNILSVDGMDFGAGIVIMWETLDAPKDGQKFIIERALNAEEDFKPVGEYSSADFEANTKQFTFEDNELGLKKAYYRIKIVEELEGVESYSEVIPVKKQVINNFKILETEKVENHQYRVAVTSIINGELKYQLATNMGEIVMQQTFEMVEGENDFLVDLDAEADGSYVVSFQNGSYTITKNFSKKSKKNDNVARKD